MSRGEGGFAMMAHVEVEEKRKLGRGLKYAKCKN